jgi:hypothetical protein
MTTTIRHYSDILKDIENYMSENHLINDLESLHDWQSSFSGEANFCSGTATWLYTFLIYGAYSESMCDLIEEVGSYCVARDIHFV